MYCSTITTSNFGIFLFPLKQIIISFHSPLLFPTLASNYLLCVSVDLPIYRILYQWNHTIWGPVSGFFH